VVPGGKAKVTVPPFSGLPEEDVPGDDAAEQPAMKATVSTADATVALREKENLLRRQSALEHDDNDVLRIFTT
jgi:hypothetical protein